MTISAAQMTAITAAVEIMNDIDSGNVDDINCKIAKFISDNGDTEQLEEYCAIEEVAASNCPHCNTTE